MCLLTKSRHLTCLAGNYLSLGPSGRRRGNYSSELSGQSELPFGRRQTVQRAGGLPRRSSPGPAGPLTRRLAGKSAPTTPCPVAAGSVFSGKVQYIPEAAPIPSPLLGGNTVAVILTGPGTALCKGIGRVGIETVYVMINLTLNLTLTVLLVIWVGPTDGHRFRVELGLIVRIVLVYSAQIVGAPDRGHSAGGTLARRHRGGRDDCTPSQSGRWFRADRSMPPYPVPSSPFRSCWLFLRDVARTRVRLAVDHEGQPQESVEIIYEHYALLCLFLAILAWSGNLVGMSYIGIV